jgi:hypothetical protein
MKRRTRFWAAPVAGLALLAIAGWAALAGYASKEEKKTSDYVAEAYEAASQSESFDLEGYKFALRRFSGESMADTYLPPEEVLADLKDKCGGKPYTLTVRDSPAWFQLKFDGIGFTLDYRRIIPEGAGAVVDPEYCAGTYTAKFCRDGDVRPIHLGSDSPSNPAWYRLESDPEGDGVLNAVKRWPGKPLFPGDWEHIRDGSASLTYEVTDLLAGPTDDLSVGALVEQQRRYGFGLTYVAKGGMFPADVDIVCRE